MQMKTGLQNWLHNKSPEPASLLKQCESLFAYNLMTSTGHQCNCKRQWNEIQSTEWTAEKYTPLFNIIYNITCLLVNVFTGHSNGDGTLWVYRNVKK